MTVTPGVSSALACCILLATAGAARAGTPVRLEIAGDLPFSAEELAQAVSARLPLAAATGDATPVAVGPARSDGVAVRVGNKRGVVPIGDRAGAAAARVVALAIADLAADEVIPSPPAPGPAPAPPPAAGPAAELAPPPSPRAPAVPMVPQLSSTFEASRGLGAAEPLSFAVLADLVAAQGRLLAGGGLGYWQTPTQRAGRPDEASFAAVVARLWIGERLGGHVQALAGPFVAPYRLGGPFARSGLLGGGGAMLRVTAPLGPRFLIVGVLRVDGFIDRFAVSVGDASPSLATPRVAVALGLGLGWDLGG
jgi:hypothetical protein